MTRQFLVFAALLCVPLSLARGQSRVGEWRHYTSTISPQAIDNHEGRVYMATRGGVLVYDPQESVFFTIAAAEGLVYTDLAYLTIAGDCLWLGGAPPQGIIQVVNLNTGAVDVVDSVLIRFSASLPGKTGSSLPAGRDRTWASWS